MIRSSRRFRKISKQVIFRFSKVFPFVSLVYNINFNYSSLKSKNLVSINFFSKLLFTIIHFIKEETSEWNVKLYKTCEYLQPIQLFLTKILGSTQSFEALMKTLWKKTCNKYFFVKVPCDFAFMEFFISLEKSLVVLQTKVLHKEKWKMTFSAHVPTFTIEAAINRVCNFQKQSFADVHKNFVIFTGKHLRCGLFLKRSSNEGVLLWNLWNF